MLNVAGLSPTLRYFDFPVTVFDQSKKNRIKGKDRHFPIFAVGATQSRWFSF